MTPLGKNFYEVGRNPANPRAARPHRSRHGATAPVDLEFGWTGDLVNRELRIRVQSAADGGVWLCIERDRSEPSRAV